MIKFAAFVGNTHAAVRVTPFFETRFDAAEHASKNGTSFDFVSGVANWEEHQKWNRERTGTYADCPVEESTGRVAKFEGMVDVDGEQMAHYSNVDLG